MTDVVELLRVAVATLFVLLGVVTFRGWTRSPSPAGARLATTFGVMTGGVVLARVAEFVQQSALTRVGIVLVALFPYSLYRFAAQFRVTSPDRGTALARLGLLIVVCWTFWVPGLGEVPASPTLPYRLYVLGFVLYWTALSVGAARILWLAASTAAAVVRRRLRTLAFGAMVLSVALIVSGASTGSRSEAVTATVQLISLASALVLYVGFSPPAFLHAWWRREQEAALHAAAVGLLCTTGAADIADVLLPSAARLVGATAMALEVDGGATARYPVDDQPSGPPWLTVENGLGRLHVWAADHAALFGGEERVLLERLGLLVDLALDRATHLEQERVARAELEAATIELEAFTYGASHDLKSPLVAMLGYVDLLRRENGRSLGEDGNWYLERIRANGAFMEALLRDLLELSRAGRVSGTTEDLDLHGLALAIADECGMQHPQAVITVESPLPAIRANEVWIRQLLGNLVGNACTHAGRPDIRVRLSRIPEPGGDVVIAVTDDGVGVPEEHRERVFGVFERIGDRTVGTGIGLAICRKIVAAMGGDIWFEPREHGAEVRVRLPARVALARSTPRLREVQQVRS